MNSIKKTAITLVLFLSVVICNAQIKNAITETVKIFGNCGMCKTAIEKAGTVKKVAQVTWNEETKTATLTYDVKQTNQDEIVKRIALAGYDSETFLAPDTAYSKLPGCCQYTREAKVPVKTTTKTDESKIAITKPDAISAHQENNQLQAVFDNYFLVKDALVKTDSETVVAKSKELLAAISAVKAEALKMEVQNVWMRVWGDFTSEAKSISETKDIKKQREVFKSLSKNTYELLKAAKLTETVYYQYCPMQDANWLSKENAVKNPYYGSQMLTCGKTVETIK